MVRITCKAKKTKDVIATMITVGDKMFGKIKKIKKKEEGKQNVLE